MKQRVKPAFTLKTYMQFKTQLKKAHALYKKKEQAYAKKGKQFTEAPSYLITNSIDEQMHLLLVTLGEMEEKASALMESDQDWGKLPLEISDALSEKLISVWAEEMAKAYVPALLPNPEALHYAAKDHEDDEGEEEEEEKPEGEENED